jgi:hypothetical protein
MLAPYTVYFKQEYGSILTVKKNTSKCQQYTAVSGISPSLDSIDLCLNQNTTHAFSLIFTQMYLNLLRPIAVVQSGIIFNLGT